MAAPDNAVPLSEENPAWLKAGLGTFTCEGCGCTGIGHELLCVEESETLWCPVCKCAAWVWD